MDDDVSDEDGFIDIRIADVRLCSIYKMYTYKVLA